MSKYIGKIYDGRWEVIKYEHYGNARSGKYTLRNIYNQNEITLKDSTLREVDRGIRTLSKALSNKMKRSKVKSKINF